MARWVIALQDTAGHEWRNLIMSSEKNLLCKLGFHITRCVTGIGPTVVCDRCNKIIQKKNTIFSKENFITAAIFLILSILLWIVGVMKGVFCF